jgi:hypothetical protein
MAGCFPGAAVVSNLAQRSFQTWRSGRFKPGAAVVSNLAQQSFQTWRGSRFKQCADESSRRE